MSKKNKHSEFIDVKGVLNGYLRRWYWFLISVIIFGALGYVYIKKNPQDYQINSSILVTDDDTSTSMLNGLGGLFGSDAYVQDEIFVITSHSVLRTVAEELGINKIHYVKTGFLTKSLEYPSFPVDVYADNQTIDTLSTILNFKVEVSKGATNADIEVRKGGKKIAELEGASLPASVKTDYGTYIVTKTDTYPGDEELTSWISVTGYDSAAEDLAKKIEAFIASKKSNVIQLSIATTNSTYGCDILNTVMDVYNQRGIEERNQRATKTAAFIQDRLDIISKDLNIAEEDIEKYKEENQLIDLAADVAINAQLKTEYDSKLVELQTQQEILEMTLKFLSSAENKYELMPVSSDDLAIGSSAVDAYNELILRHMTMLDGAKPNNRQVLDVEKQIDAMRANILVALERAIKSNAVALKDVRRQSEMALSKLGNVPTQEREYRNLQRQQEVKQQLYIFLLERREETSMMLANAIPKGTVIDAAYVMRDPVGPGKIVILLIAVLIGLILPVIAIYIKNILRSRVDGRSDIEKITGLPILGEMCIDKSGSKLVVTEDSSTPSAELFRMIRANLQFVLGNPGDKVVLVTSSMSGEGKSFISSNMAATLALLGCKVVLIGMDIRKPQLANYLEVPSSPGLTQYLSNSQVQLDTIMQDYEPIPGMKLIVAGPIPPNPGELMTSPRIGELLSELRKRFDYIIIDSAPVGMVSDSFNLAKYTDATVYIVRDKTTRLHDLQFLSDIAEEGRLRRINVILNGTSTTKGYGYGYSRNNKA